MNGRTNECGTEVVYDSVLFQTGIFHNVQICVENILHVKNKKDIAMEFKSSCLAVRWIIRQKYKNDMSAEEVAMFASPTRSIMNLLFFFKKTSESSDFSI